MTCNVERIADDLLMTRVANHETDVVFRGELHSSNNVVSAGDVDGVVDIVAEHARLVLGSKGVAALISEVGLHYR